MNGKLVRDRLPAKARSSGERIVVAVLDDVSFVNALMEKMSREFTALSTDLPNKEATASHVAELHLCLKCVCETLGLTEQAVQQMYNIKINTEGGYDARLYQMEIPDQPVPPQGNPEKPA